jgi:hypothetical protein
MNQLPVVDEVVTVLNLACVLGSVVANWWAARVGLFRLRTVHAAITTVSLLYVGGYLWLLFGNVDPARWSSVFRGISLVAWVVVWVVPAVVSVRMSGELHAAIKDRQQADK